MSGSEKVFAFLGKLILIVVLVGVVAFGGYYFGTHYMDKPSQQAAQTTVPAPTVEVTPTLTPEMVSPSLTPTTAVTAKKVSAGIQTQFFSTYSVTIPQGWTDAHTSDATAKMDKLTVTKGAYVLTISQASGGGGSCIFAGEPQPMAQVFDQGVAIPGATSQFRRGSTDGMNYTVCENKSTGYSFPTSFGYITYVTPKPADAVTLAEMDGMIASLAK